MMRRRILLLLLPFALLLSVGARAAAQTEPEADRALTIETLDPLLPRSRSYQGQFPDVSAGAWYYNYVSATYEYGLLEGRDIGFAPDANITLAEVITLSARIHAAYAKETIPVVRGSRWYVPYVSYLRERGLLDSSLISYTEPATRAQLASVFARSLPENCYDGRNAALVDDAYASGAFIADVGTRAPYQQEILWLYGQGLLRGMDELGSYWPDQTTTRAEVAAVAARMVDPALRITLDWEVPHNWSAVGTKLSDLVEAPARVVSGPAYDDAAAIDALTRRMLAAGEHTIDLSYKNVLTASDANTLNRVFLKSVKSYCEQMYNAVSCQRYLNSGSATMTFYATACIGEGGRILSDQLEHYREAAMARAIEVHDMLWENGTITADMSQYDVAKVYYQWLCENCVYDHNAASDAYSISHIAYSALVDGKAVCDGYTGAYDLFLKLEGIDCYALNNATHIWTVATLDGVSYHIDTTWGDQTDLIDWSLFGMTEEESYAVHPWP